MASRYRDCELVGWLEVHILRDRVRFRLVGTAKGRDVVDLNAIQLARLLNDLQRKSREVGLLN